MSTSGTTGPESPGGVIEDLDARIVSELAADGRLSVTELGKRVGLSSSAAHQRVRRLEQRGVIRGYKADIDPVKVGRPLTALISLQPFDPAAPDDIPERIDHFSEVVSCWSVAGDQSYVLLVHVARPQHLEDLLARLRSEAGCSTRTTIVLSTPWENRPYGPADPQAPAAAD